MPRCARSVRSFAGLSLAAVLVVSAAGCDAGRRVDAGRHEDPAPTTTAAPSPSTTTTVLLVTQPPETAVPPGATATDDELSDDLASIDHELAELDAALQEFDQMTATTEGDPSR